MAATIPFSRCRSKETTRPESRPCSLANWPGIWPYGRILVPPPGWFWHSCWDTHHPSRNTLPQPRLQMGFGHCKGGTAWEQRDWRCLQVPFRSTGMGVPLSAPALAPPTSLPTLCWHVGTTGALGLRCPLSTQTGTFTQQIFSLWNSRPLDVITATNFLEQGISRVHGEGEVCIFRLAAKAAFRIQRQRTAEYQLWAAHGR